MINLGHTPAYALEAEGLGRRFRRGWALRDCTFTVPPGRIAAMVGANGAGKSTLMKLAVGLLAPTSGSIRVGGARPKSAVADSRVGFLAQEKPLFGRFTVAEMLRVGRALNATWDEQYAKRLVQEADIPMSARIKTLSGGQRTRVALALVMGRRPGLLVLDEPLADLDPLARRDVLHSLLAEVTDTGTTVLLSSHVLAELEHACDYLVVMSNGRVILTGSVEDLLTRHHIVTGHDDNGLLRLDAHAVVETRTTGRQTTALIHARGALPPQWTAGSPTLEELVLGYLRAETKMEAVR
ncbi:ABC transporter ATP-binding protein [Micromonospora chersina]|uniref:ABC transporter ATP-binding protein n=1 Tax=Micromonospora chersina TaxID=47854 RepID=UPI00379FCC13